MNRQKISQRPLPPRKLPPECLCCGEGNPWVVNKVEVAAPFRDIEHVIRAEVNQCRYCDTIATTEEQSAAISAQVRDGHRKWISEKLKAAQKKLGFSLRELSGKSSIPFATLGRISSGDHLIEATMEKLLWREIEKLTHARTTARFLQMEQREFRVMNVSILIESDLTNSRVYTRILQTAAQSPLVKRRDFQQEEQFSDAFLSNLVPA